jgi:hypothetical protein
MDINFNLKDLIKTLELITVPAGNYDYDISGGYWRENMYSDEQIQAAKLVSQCIQIAKDHPDD